MAVALLKLLVVEFKVIVQHSLPRDAKLKSGDCRPAGYGLGDLYGQQRLPHVGVGKQDAQLLLKPEFVEEHHGRGYLLGVFQTAVGGAHGEDGRFHVPWYRALRDR